MMTIFIWDRKFHLAIAEAAYNPLLFQQISSIHDKVMLIHGQKIETTPTWFNGIIAEHERILSALGRRDVAVADAEMRYHLESVVRLHLGLKQEPYKKRSEEHTSDLQSLMRISSDVFSLKNKIT